MFAKASMIFYHGENNLSPYFLWGKGGQVKWGLNFLDIAYSIKMIYKYNKTINHPDYTNISIFVIHSEVIPCKRQEIKSRRLCSLYILKNYVTRQASYILNSFTG